ncbi:ankyrin repeat-containing protein, putative [Talaromyces stipitatus ATCC 10500]|uniref:Ankyrin repeat-containing protein, putative n=1 Tax=Talaromyces stipitatus (strain ATCC 10500 / CBS 375.48 / QM 6759 / NRRL 1006) TaxID=441959 RepID=B8M682_TALSN|nr:ankyrin repeat-containing protein, putative [Talaromyces stipitatus ATCC 10500]EED19082.1 ankyrin repeat-containing protein, putative [Talaromyces stipitatus ATCC 10500]
MQAQNALQASAYCGNLEATNALLEAGAPSHEKNGFHRPGGSIGGALQAATMRGDQALVKALIDNGASVNEATGWVCTLLSSVLERGMVKMACLLENGARPDIIAGYYVSSLHMSAGSSLVFDEMLEKVENVDVNLFPYDTPLQIACDAENWYTVEKLLARSGDVHAPAGQFGTAIHAACYSGSLHVVRALLRSGANMNSLGLSLVMHGSREITIPYYGKAVFLIGGIGLHDHWPHDKYLNDHWDDLFPKIGFYGLSLAEALRIEERTHNKVLALFEFEPTHQEGHYGDSLQVAAFQGHFRIVKTLLEHNAEVNSICGVFGTALEAAAYAGHHKIVEILLKNGADPTIQDDFYGFPLLVATTSGNSRVSVILLQAGADPNAGDEHGWTQADW